MKGQMDGCCNGEWGGERGRLAGMGFASKCMRHWSYSRMHKCSLFHSYTRTHILIGFDCFLDNGIVFSRIRGGSYALVFQHSCSKPVHQLIYFTGNSLFRCPSKGHCSVPPLQEVVTFHVFFFFCFFYYDTISSRGGCRQKGAWVKNPGEPPQALMAEEEVLICAVAQSCDAVDVSIFKSSICLEIHWRHFGTEASK